MGLFGDGQARELAQARLQLAVAAAFEVGAADAALKDRIAHKEILAAQQHHTALGVAGGVPCGEGQLIHRKVGPLSITEIGALQGEELGPGAVGGFAPDLCAPLTAQHTGAAHMVVVAVGAQDVRQHGAVVPQDLIVLLHLGRRVDDDRMACLGEQQKTVGVKRRRAEKMKCLHVIPLNPSFSTRRCR